MAETRELVQQLDGAAIRRLDPAWAGFFVGAVAVENIEPAGDLLQFDVLLPTAASDMNDFIWRNELDRGRTDKIVLHQANSDVRGWMTAIRREADSYRLTFQLPVELDSGGALELHIRWLDSDGRLLREIARAARPT